MKRITTWVVWTVFLTLMFFAQTPVWASSDMDSEPVSLEETYVENEDAQTAPMDTHEDVDEETYTDEEMEPQTYDDSDNEVDDDASEY